MKNNRNRLSHWIQVIALLGTFQLVVPAPLHADKNAATSSVVKIGVIVPLTGDMGFAGEEVRNGLLLAKERLGKTHYNYQLIFEDNGLDLNRSVSAARKLIEVNKVDAVVTLWPPTANVVAPITEKAEILHYTIAWDPSIARNHKYVLSHQSMVDAFAHATLKLLQKQGVRRLAFFQLNESGFNVGADVLRELAPSYGIELAAWVVFDAGQQDFRAELLRVKNKQADGILIWAVIPEINALIRQIKEARFEHYLTGFFDVIEDLSTIEGLTFVSEVNSTEEFAAEYRKRFKRDFVLKAPNAYDLLNLLVQVYEKRTDRKASAAELKETLTNVRGYSGAVGRVDIDQFGNSSYPPTFKKVVEGKLKTLQLAD